LNINNNLSFVIPVFNEKQNIRILVDEILELSPKLASFEIIIVDDGSDENIYSEICDADKVVYIKHKKNLGQGKALLTGIEKAKFDIIVTLDGDLQNDVKDIFKMYYLMIQKNLDMVCGYRKNRKDPLLKNISSRISYFFRELLLKDNIYDSGCALKVCKKNALLSVRLDKNFFMFVTALFEFEGFKVGQCIVTHRPRMHGNTKYSYLSQFFTGFSYIFYLYFIRKIKRKNRKGEEAGKPG